MVDPAHHGQETREIVQRRRKSAVLTSLAKILIVAAFLKPRFSPKIYSKYVIDIRWPCLVHVQEFNNLFCVAVDEQNNASTTVIVYQKLTCLRSLNNATPTCKNVSFQSLLHHFL